MAYDDEHKAHWIALFFNRQQFQKLKTFAIVAMKTSFECQFIYFHPKKCIIFVIIYVCAQVKLCNSECITYESFCFLILGGYSIQGRGSTDDLLLNYNMHLWKYFYMNEWMNLNDASWLVKVNWLGIE